MRAIKGANCETTRRMVRKDVGEDRFRACVESMPKDLQRLATRRIMAVEWIDFDQWLQIEQTFFERLYDGNYEAYRDLSRRVSEHDFGTFYRALLKIGTPGYIVVKSAAAFRQIFDFGSLECVKVEKHPTRESPTILRLSGVPNMPSFVAGLHGGIEALLHLSRGHEPDIWIGARSGTDANATIDYHLKY